MGESLSLRQARALALAAQGLARPRAEKDVTRLDLKRCVERLGLLQIDSVNVFARAHTMPLFSRHGAYDTTHLHDLAYGGRKRVLFEYWAHEASYLPVALQPMLRWRMARAERGEGIYSGLATFGREQRPFIDRVLAEIGRRGALSASELEDGGTGKGSWWGWSHGKHALEFLFWAGLVTTATRRGTFERVYDLPERVLPRAILDMPTPPEADAQRVLLRHAASALGVATERDLRDYFRLEVADTRLRLMELVEAGELEPVSVEGWKDEAYRIPGLALPRRASATALLSPFDPLIWERARTERLFGFHYRIEIYTPQEKRQFGYYTLPFLMGDRIVGRLDLKADRGVSKLRVLSAHHEAGVDPVAVSTALAAELALAAAWLGLNTIEVHHSGNLAAALSHAIG